MNAPPPQAPEATAGSRWIDKRILGSRILIVDDEPLVCRLLAGIFKKQQFGNITFATGGQSALEQIDAVKPDIVLLDVQMPDLGGIEVCERIRAKPECVDLPILVHSATFDRQGAGVLFAAGASDFVSKPINPSELVSRVALHLERRKLLIELRDYRERTSQELDAARRMQFDLLPSVADQQNIAAAAGLRIGSYSRSSSEIGGDFWGVLPVDDASFAVFLADFAGHGVTAALNTFRLHAMIHEHNGLYHDPPRLLAMLNQRLVRLLSPGQFATFVYVLVEPAADRIRFASAGAPPLVMACESGTELIEASGLPLGISGGAEYQLHQCAFPRQSTLLIYSDGLSEFPNRDGSRIGDEGLRSAVQALPRGQAPLAIIDQICVAAGVRADDPLPDDTTIVCLDRWTDVAPLAPRQDQPGHVSAASRKLLERFEYRGSAMNEQLMTPLLDAAQIAALREAVGDDDLREMLSELPEATRQGLDAIKAAVASDDLNGARHAAHTLKGVASSFGAARIAAMALALEHAATLTPIVEAVPALDALIDRTVAALADV